MKVARGIAVLVGGMLVAGCAARAQGDVADPSSSSVGYFESNDSAPRAASRAFAGPPRWARVDPRFRVAVEELAGDVGNWGRTSKRPADAAPLLTQLADAIDAMPRGDRVGPFRDTREVRAMAAELGGGSLDDAQQRRSIREALLLVARQLSADAHGNYVTDAEVGRAVHDLQTNAAAVSDTAPDSAIELGLVTASDALRAFELALANGRVSGD